MDLYIKQKLIKIKIIKIWRTYSFIYLIFKPIICTFLKPSCFCFLFKYKF